MDDLREFIQPQLLALVPVLCFIGTFLKKSTHFSDQYIPLMLGGIGVGLAVMHTAAVMPIQSYHDALLAVFVGITQGILCAGGSVYCHQIIKQSRKKEE